MKNTKQYNYINLFIFSCVIGIISGLSNILIKYLLNISPSNLIDKFLGGAITGATIVILLSLLHKTGKDKFLLKKEDKNNS